jgi:Asp-tRNA(Asn)/Glu-tRNA(Gln) amidotransferase B subunit
MKSFVLKQELQPTGIPSGEAFGTPAISAENSTQVVQPDGIPSGEAFGTPAIAIAKLLDEVVKVANLVKDGALNRGQAKEVLERVAETGKSAEEIIKTSGLVQLSDSSVIEKIVDDVIAANEANVAAYRGGNEKLFGFFVGQVMKASQGKANPKIVNELLRSKL